MLCLIIYRQVHIKLSLPLNIIIQTLPLCKHCLLPITDSNQSQTGLTFGAIRHPIPKRMLLFIASQEKRFSWCFLAMHRLFCCAHLLQFFALFFECINSSVVHIPCSSIGECTPHNRNDDLHCKFFYEAWSMNFRKILVSAVKRIFLYAYDLFLCTLCPRVWYGAKIIRNMGM